MRKLVDFFRRKNVKGLSRLKGGKGGVSKTLASCQCQGQCPGQCNC